jgi:hypothetical protein
MSKLTRAIEILEAINEFFDQSAIIQTPLFPEAQILEGDITIQEAIVECLSEEIEEVEPEPAPVPKHLRRSYGFNEFLGLWACFIGPDRVFYTDTVERAREWVNGE